MLGVRKKAEKTVFVAGSAENTRMNWNRRVQFDEASGSRIWE